MPKGIHIAIADDHKLLLSSFAKVLEAFAYVQSVSTCGNYSELNTAIAVQVPDVVFLDLNLPPHNGLDICAELRKKYDKMCIIVLTSYTEHARVQAAEQNGANAYFIKSVEIEAIDQYLREWIAGKTTGFVSIGVDTIAEPAPEYKRNGFAAATVLTPREKEIAQLIVAGKTHTEITEQLRISYDTYKTHRSNVLQKLGLKNVAELVAYSYKSPDR